MKLRSIQPLAFLAATLILMVNCSGNNEPLPDTEATLKEKVQGVLTTTPAPATNAPSTSTIAHSTPVSPTIAVVTATAATESGLAALCSLNQEAEKITCRASGVPEGTQSQLKWESNISGWQMGPTYEISIREWVSAVIVTLELCQDSDCENVEAYVDTSRVTPGDSGGGSGDNTSPPPTADTTTGTTTTGLAAFCSLDEEAEKITCRASGVPEGTQSQLKWESNISGWQMGPTYEISITEYTEAVTVKLELCQGSDCENVDAYVDTSRVTPGDSGGGSGDNTSPPPTADTTTGTTTTGLAAFCSLDEEAEKITCRASGAPEGAESQLKWESNISGLELGSTYEISITEWVSAVIVTLELCRDSDCENVEAYVDTSRVTPTPPTSGTSSQTPTPTVVAIESQTRDRMFDGIYPCTEDNTRAFTASIVPTNLLTKIEPMGKMSDSHVTPTDHLYVHWARPVSGITEYVVAPADGQIVEIQRFPSDKVVRYDTSITVPDYRMVIMHSCAFFTIFIHMAELAPAIAEQAGPIPFGGQWFSTHSGPIEVKAGDPLSKISGTGLDWSVHDADVTLSGFIAPEHYGEVWKIHTVDPFQFYEEPLRSELLSKAVRKVEPRAGKIDYDIEGTILGNWFLEGTIDYGGNTNDSGYWKGHLAIAYGWIDPSQVRISIGFDTGINDNQLCNVCFSAYGVRGNQPDPVTVGKETGLVKYELMSRQGPYHEQVGETALGTFLVQHLGDRTIRVELITGKSPQEVTGFSIDALIYHR